MRFTANANHRARVNTLLAETNAHNENVIHASANGNAEWKSRGVWNVSFEHGLQRTAVYEFQSQPWMLLKVFLQLAG
jgi:hypothetical protein